MARYLPAELDQIFPDPKEVTGWDWQNLAPDSISEALDWIEGIPASGSAGRAIAEKTIDSAGLISSFATAEILRGLAINPSIGIQESKAGLRDRMEALAEDNFTLPTHGTVWGNSWLGSLGGDLGGDLIGSELVKISGDGIKIDPTVLAQALGGIAMDRLATIVIGATAAVPYVGWMVSALLAVGRGVAKRNRALQQIHSEEAKWAGAALSSGLCAVPESFGGSGSAWISTADKRLSQDVVKNTANPNKPYIPPGMPGSTESAGKADLSYALMPHRIPNGHVFLGRPGDASPGDYAVGTQDRNCVSDAPPVPLSVFSGHIMGGNVGSGYMPGLGMVGRPVFTARHGRLAARREHEDNSGSWVCWNANLLDAAGLFERSDLGDSLSATTALCRSIEGMTLRAPLCYQVQTWRIREAWTEAIEGWQGVAIHAKNIQHLPAKDIDALPLYGRGLVAPAPWLFVSRVKVTSSNGSTISALRQGPEVLHLPGWNVGPWYGRGECDDPPPNAFAAQQNRTNQDPVGVAWRRQMIEMMFGLRESVDFSLWTKAPSGALCGDPGDNSFFDLFQVRSDYFGGHMDLPMWWPTDYTKHSSAKSNWYKKNPRFFDIHPERWGDGVEAVENPHYPSCSDMYLYKPEQFKEWREQSHRAGPWGPEEPIYWKDRSRTFSASSTATVKTWGPMGMCVEPYLQRVEKKQWDALDTLQCAYVSHSAPAFEEGTPGVFLRARLIERRTQLLQHSARFEVHLADVVDSVDNEPPNILTNYRAMLKASGVGKFGPGGPQLAPGTPGEPEAWKGPADFEIEIPDPSPPGPGGPGSITVDVYQPPPPEDDPEQEQEEAPPLPVPMGGSEIASKPDETIPEVESDEERRAGLLVPVAIAAGALALTRKR